MDDYLMWLMAQVDCPVEYSRLMTKLGTRAFTWLVRKDANRAGDGMMLRGRYVNETGAQATEDLFMRPCSVLEMMIALACRMENDIMYDPEFGNRTPEWFRIMIENLGLDGMDDERYDEEYVNNVLNVFLNRTYYMNGSGGLFPLKQPKHNQRRVEIWYQMSEYLVENFD